MQTWWGSTSLDPENRYGSTSPDYMHGVYLMLQQPESGDLVLATGHSYSVRDFVDAAFDVVGTNIE